MTFTNISNRTVFNQGNSVNKNLKPLFFYNISRNTQSDNTLLFSLIMAPINGLKLNIISMQTFPEIYY
ncbi:hypothetical protein T02_14940 [Trichinella nativa]|uniref:Uncharacterized protein n=1 Tax=Trichinella nativa TaxID=6335 RepID=A0A0V1L405_9BILA|nr:hypothetical protein T02_14940 [Trichinella nativa]